MFHSTSTAIRCWRQRDKRTQRLAAPLVGIPGSAGRAAGSSPDARGTGLGQRGHECEGGIRHVLMCPWTHLPNAEHLPNAKPYGTGACSQGLERLLTVPSLSATARRPAPFYFPVLDVDPTGTEAHRRHRRVNLEATASLPRSGLRRRSPHAQDAVLGRDGTGV